MKDKLTRFLWILARLAIRSAIAGAASWWVRWWAVPAAYTERGYKAVGGEWVLIAFTFIFVFWLMGIYVRKEDEYYAAKVSAMSQDFENPGSH